MKNSNIHTKSSCFLGLLGIVGLVLVADTNFYKQLHRENHLFVDMVMGAAIVAMGDYLGRRISNNSYSGNMQTIGAFIVGLVMWFITSAVVNDFLVEVMFVFNPMMQSISVFVGNNLTPVLYLSYVWYFKNKFHKRNNIENSDGHSYAAKQQMSKTLDAVVLIGSYYLPATIVLMSGVVINGNVVIPPLSFEKRVIAFQALSLVNLMIQSWTNNRVTPPLNVAAMFYRLKLNMGPVIRPFVPNLELPFRS